MIRRQRRFSAILLALAIAILGTSHPASAAENEPLQLVPGAPERYVVQDGDTLWGIAQKFLVNPWKWPEIWQMNPGLENPHLLYPGDVLVLAGSADGEVPQVKVLRNRKVTKLSPEIRVVFPFSPHFSPPFAPTGVKNPNSKATTTAMTRTDLPGPNRRRRVAPSLFIWMFLRFRAPPDALGAPYVQL